MSRCAFISAGGDCFLSLLMLRLFKRWRDEVDHLYICFNATIDPAISDYVASEYAKEPKATWIFSPKPLGFGIPINKCLEACNEGGKEDIILLLEDDGMIFEQGRVNDLFQKIEGGGVDAIGSPRFSCTDEIANAVKEKYGLDYSGTGDKGPVFWPNFFFVKREDLMKTDLNFAGKGWKAGEYIKELDMTCKEEQAGDTFVSTCLQLRAMGLKFHDVLQNHASPTEIEDIPLKRYNHDYGFQGWIHGGSLSSGWNGFLLTPPSAQEGLSIQEFETRAAFWDLVSEVEEIPDKEFTKRYRRGIDDFVREGGLNRGRVSQKKAFYKNLLKL